VSAADFDRLVAITFWTSVVLLVCAGVLMAYALVLHRRTVAVRERRDDVVDSWRALFRRALEGELSEPPALANAEAFAVLTAWNAIKDEPGEATGPDGMELLDGVARRAGLDLVALSYVYRGDAAEYIVGATALGHLRDGRAIDRLRTLADEADGEVSFAASAALLRIDPVSAAAFVERLGRRSDWFPTRVERVVREAAAIIGAKLPRAIVGADAERRVRLLRYAGLLAPGVAREAIESALHGEPDEETIAAALRTLRDNVRMDDLPLLRRYVDHPSAAVRVQTVNALSKLGGPEARPLLLARLHDSNAWVRQRAAEAIATNEDDYQVLLESVWSDKYAYQSLRHAFEGVARGEG
jgi:hypothetical protein